MRLQQSLLALVVFMVVFLGIYTSLGIMTSEEGYNTNTSTDITYQEKYDLMLDISQNIERDYTTLQNVTVDKGAGFFTGVASAFSLGKNIVTSPFRVINVIWSAMMEDLNLPAWLNGVAATVIIILFIFALLAIILRWKA